MNEITIEQLRKLFTTHWRQAMNLNEEIARLLFPDADVNGDMGIYKDSGGYAITIPNYSEDFNEIYRVCLERGHVPETKRSKVFFRGVHSSWINVSIDVFDAVVDLNQKPDEITKAIAEALCELLLRAEAENGE